MEENTNYFLGVEKKSHQLNCIRQVTVENGDTIENEPTILKIARILYSDLFTSKSYDSIHTYNYFTHICKRRTITPSLFEMY